MSPSISSMIMLLGATTAWAATAPAYAPPTYSPPTYSNSTGAVSNCAKACNDAYNTCRTQPGANMATCTSQLASCVNYSPFDNSGSFVLPTACSASSTAAATAPAYTSSPSTSDCAKNCVAAYRQCQTTPHSNKAQCVADLARCVNYSPFDNSGSFVEPTACSTSSSAGPTAPAYTTSTAVSACAKGCNDAYNTCRSAPDANMSYCASQLASCLNYNPFDNSGSFVTPTACSAASSTSAAVTKSVCSKSSSSAPASSASPAPTAGATISDCAKNCNTAYDACRVAPNANMASCAAQYAACVNYNPFTGGAFTSATACSSSSTAPSTGGATGAAVVQTSTLVVVPTGAAVTGTKAPASTTPVKYMGAASTLSGCGAMVAVVAGVVGLMM